MVGQVEGSSIIGTAVQVKFDEARGDVSHVRLRLDAIQLMITTRQDADASGC
ncbi:hypothetical protein QA634_07470 [Methylobacterium sp. CB376]|uniref:hypothetical protein n=1 Tax=unclassified Methylobacterium TaxID=2615210 RepID=UPI0014395709|nr:MULTISPECIES: hypothetical protein [Methylobacterium]WFT81696.1 hypothetical protein QA634_07470 [Methylobacterium nodulans]